MAEKSISIDILGEYDVVVNDFYSWEILDPYMESDSDNFSISDEEEGKGDDEVKPEIKDLRPQEEFVSLVSQLPSERQLLVVDDVMPETKDPSPKEFVNLLAQLPPQKFKNQMGDDCAIGGGAVRYDDSEEKYVNEDDEVENDDLYDDQLDRFGLSGKFAKERISKTGKRACGRKKTSKKMPHYYTRPGCVHGKHSLGVTF